MITEKDMQHGQNYEGENVNGWWVSEKYKGCRLYWDGSNMWSRGGINVNIPSEWKEQLPDISLDGELYDGPDGQDHKECHTLYHPHENQELNYY